MMNRSIKFSTVILLVSILVLSCKKEEERKLTISDIVVENHDGGKQVPRGGTISVNFKATAGVARLDFYHIEIHDHPVSGLVEDEYKIIDDAFTDKVTFKGLREASVHQHVVVPAEANLGIYHVVIVVVDEDGYSVDTEDLDTSIEIIE
jgi:hypothetical protein